MKTNDENTETRSLSFLEILVSTLSAAIGVQTRARMERDLTQGEIMKFIAAGVLFTILFVVGMISIVNLVLAG